MKIFIYVFPYDFLKFEGLSESRCDIPNHTTQGWVFDPWTC